MPIVENEGLKLVVFGTGDIGMGILEDKESDMNIITFSPMEKIFKLGSSPTPEEVYTNAPVISFGFYNVEGVDNLINILESIKDKFKKGSDKQSTKY